MKHNPAATGDQLEPVGRQHDDFGSQGDPGAARREKWPSTTAADLTRWHKLRGGFHRIKTDAIKGSILEAPEVCHRHAPAAAPMAAGNDVAAAVEAEAAAMKGGSRWRAALRSPATVRPT